MSKSCFYSSSKCNTTLSYTFIGQDVSRQGKIVHAKILIRASVDKKNILQLRTRLASYSVDPFDLSIITQTDCPKESSEGYNIHIDSDTFSAANVANVFRKAGEKIGDGVEWTIGATKKVGGVAKTILF